MTTKKKEPRRKIVELQVVTTRTNAELRAACELIGMMADGTPWKLSRRSRRVDPDAEGVVQVTVNDVQGDR